MSSRERERGRKVKKKLVKNAVKKRNSKAKKAKSKIRHLVKMEMQVTQMIEKRVRRASLPISSILNALYLRRHIHGSHELSHAQQHRGVFGMRSELTNRMAE